MFTSTDDEGIVSFQYYISSKGDDSQSIKVYQSICELDVVIVLKAQKVV